MLNYEFYKSPLGNICLVANNDALYWLDFIEDDENLDIVIEEISSIFKDQLIQKNNKIINQTMQELDLYFSGKLIKFTVPLKTFGTDFQKQVWNALCEIPYGETISYKQQAININNEKAVRAVGGANGKNKIAVIIPCHRVIGSNKQLTGFASGIWRKQWLLEHEEKYRKAW